MSDKRWRRDEVNLGDRFELDGLVYKVIGLIDDPVAVLVPAHEADGEDTEHHVICSRNFARFDKLVPQRPGGSQ